MFDGEVIGDLEMFIFFNGCSVVFFGYVIVGIVVIWWDFVVCLVGGNLFMMLGVVVVLFVLFIGLVGVDGFGVYLFEQLSVGKIIIVNIVSSLWGEFDVLWFIWYGIVFGIVNEVEVYNDSLLLFDEVGQGSSVKDVVMFVYILFNGVGKLQGVKEGGNWEFKCWCIVVISIGEMDIEIFLVVGGLKVKVG